LGTIFGEGSAHGLIDTFRIDQAVGRENAHGFFFGQIEMNVVLIGYRCSGKTEVGQSLAEKMNRPFLDTDVLIEQRCGSTIEAMVASRGWGFFRACERLVVAEVSHKSPLVIATGGGVVLDGDNVTNLNRKGWLVWLKAPAQVLRERMAGDRRQGRGRPSLTDQDPLGEIEAVLEQREPVYEKASDWAVDTALRSIAEVTALILDEYERRNGI
jgi:shikimate kinase